MFTGIEHFAIAAVKPQTLAQWYADHLDFVINYEYDGNYFVRAKDGAMIEIIPAQGDRGEPAMRTPGMRHIAISVKDFDAAYEHLKGKGVVFKGEPFTNQGNRLVFFEDAEGNLLHLIEREKPLP